MNQDRPRSLVDLKFIKKFWLLFLTIALIVAGVKEARRLFLPDSYIYEIKLSAVPKSLMIETRDALESVVWKGSGQGIKNSAVCLPDTFHYNCNVEASLNNPLSKQQLDGIQRATEQLAQEFAERFTFAYKVQELASPQEFEEFLLRHDSYDIWIFRNLAKEAAQQGISSEQIKTCSFLGGIQACNEYLRQEMVSKVEQGSASPFLKLVLVNQNTLIDIQKFKMNAVKPFQVSVGEKISSPRITDFSALGRSLLFGFSISLLIHSFLYLLVLPKD